MTRSLFDVRPEERKAAAAAFFTLFGILAGHTILETARDALFLSRLPARQLPWMYLAIACVAVLLSESPWQRLSRRVGRYSLSTLLLVSAAVTVFFWWSAAWAGPFKLYGLYVWTGVFGTLAGVEFWLILGELYTVTQAKRIFRLVGTGSVLGAVAGSGFARLMAGSYAADALLLGAAVAFCVTGLGPALLLRGGAETASPRPATSLRKAATLVHDHVYLRNLAVLTLISTVALTLADFVFKSAVSRNVPKESLASFFATFYMSLNLLALVAQFAVSAFLMRVLGLHRALWVLPTLLVLGSAGVILGGGLVAALFLKGSDGALRYSVHKTGTELLFVPLSDSLRSRAKPLIDVIGQRGGQALASLVILAESALHRGDAVLAAASGAMSIVWIAWSSDLKRLYLDLFREALREGSIQSSVDLPELDLGSLESLFAALNSSDDREVLGALDLLGEEGRAHLVPAMILYHPSSAVVLRALSLFQRFGREDFVPIADRLLGHSDPEVRAAALRARTAARADEGVLREATADVDPLVRTTAIVGLVSNGWATEEDRAALGGIPCSSSVRTRLALARAMAEQPDPAFEPALLQLADSSEDEVRLEVARAMGAVKADAFLPTLVTFLASHEVRGAARDALVAHGRKALEFLAESLADDALPHEMRRHLPRAVAAFDAREAARILERRLIVEQDGMVRFKIIRSLGRIASADHGLRFDKEILTQAIDRTIAAISRLEDWRSTLERGAAERPERRTSGHELLTSLLKDKEAHAVERMFRLLSLRFRRENFKPIYRGLRSPNAKIRANSRELLENVLRPPLREEVLRVIDTQRGAEPSGVEAPAPADYEGLLARLLDEPSETLRCLAGSQIGELGLVALADRLRNIDRRRTGLFVRQVYEKALRQLDGAASQARAHA